MVKAKADYSAAAKGTTHRDIQDLEEEVHVEEEEQKIRDAEAREKAMRAAAARVVSHYEKARAATIAEQRADARSAAGQKVRKEVAMVGAAARHTALNPEAAVMVQTLALEGLRDAEEEARLEAEEQALAQGFRNMFNDEDDAEAAPQVAPRDQAALAVVLAREQQRRAIDAGEHYDLRDAAEELGMKKRHSMLQAPNFPSHAGERRHSWVADMHRAGPRGGPGHDPASPSRAASTKSFRGGTFGGVLGGLRTRALKARAASRTGRWPAANYGGGLEQQPVSEITLAGTGVTDSDFGASGRPLPHRENNYSTTIEGSRPPDWEQRLLETYPTHGMPHDRLNKRMKICRVEFGNDGDKGGNDGDKGGGSAEAEGGAEDAEEEVGTKDNVRVCPTFSVSPILPKDIDEAMTSVHADNINIRWPGAAWAPPVQMWEPFVMCAILSLPYFQDFFGHEKEEDIKTADECPSRFSWHERHVEKLLQFTKKMLRQTFPSPVIREHLRHPSLRSEGTRFVLFLSAFLRKKFEPYEFKPPNLAAYIRESLFETLSSPDGRTMRVFIISPWVLDFLRDEPDSMFCGQYDEMVQAAQAVGLPVCNVTEYVTIKRAELTKQTWSAIIEQRDAPTVEFEHVHVYLDSSLIQRRYGGYSLARDEPYLTHSDRLLVRKVGANLEDIVAGKNIFGQVSKNRVAKQKKKTRAEMAKEQKEAAQAALEARSASFHSFFSDNELATDPTATAFHLERKRQKRARDIEDRAAITHVHKTLAEKGEEQEREERLRREEEEMQQRDEWEELMAQCIDPESVRFMPLGFSLAEAFLLIHGMVAAMDRRPDADGDGQLDADEGIPRLLRTNLAGHCKDQHVLSAAILIDLYMREKVDIWAWQLSHDDARIREMGHLFGQSDEHDPFSGEISNCYRVFAPEDAPFWTSEVPLYPGAKSGAPHHWLEVYVPLAEEIFQSMDLPTFVGEEPVWDAMLDRGMLIPTGEDTEGYRVLETEGFPRLARCCGLLRRVLACCCPCLRRRRGADSFGSDASGTGARSGACLGRCRTQEKRDPRIPRHDRARADLEVYEVQPLELPAQLRAGAVGRWVDELTARRRVTNQGIDPSDRPTFRVGEHVLCFSDVQRRWVKAKVTKIRNGWITVAYKDKDGRKAKKDLPEGHPHIKPKEIPDVEAQPAQEVARPLENDQDEDEQDEDEQDEDEDEEEDAEDGQGQAGEDAADAAGGSALGSDEPPADQPAAERKKKVRSMTRRATAASVASSSGTSKSSASSGSGRSRSGASGKSKRGKKPAKGRLHVDRAESKQSEQTASASVPSGGSQFSGPETFQPPVGQSSESVWEPASLEKRREFWETLKVMYCDAYFLMYEEGAIYFEEEQEVALWRAQLLMFFFAWQELFEVAWESYNGLERVFQAHCPPFAKLPLRPPHGMEAAGAVIRGIIDRARLAGTLAHDDGIRNLAMEAGEFQEKVRARFETQLYACPNIVEVFDRDSDGEITLQEFIAGIQALPAKGQLRFGGMPAEVLDGVIRDLAAELFIQMDEDGSGTLSIQEVKEAVDARRAEAEAHNKESTAVRAAKDQLQGLMAQIPGTAAHRQWKEAEKLRLARVHDGFEKLKKLRALKEHTIEEEIRFKNEAMGRVEPLEDPVSLRISQLNARGDF